MAALIVVFYHFISIFYPAIMGIAGAPVHSPYDVLIAKTPLSFLFAGNFAVVVFFVLSGFVLTVKYFSSSGGSLFPAAVKRYVRLMPIALVSVLLGYFLSALHLVYFGAASPLTGSVFAYFLFEPSLGGALFQGLVTAFSVQQPLTLSYNPVLWTIYYEMVGSLLVFGLATLAKGQPKRWLLYLVAAIVFVDSYFVGFIVGAALADLYATRPVIFEKIRNSSAVYKWGALLLAISMAAYHIGRNPVYFGKYWNSLTLFSTDFDISKTILQLTAAVIIIVLALSWTKYTKFLELRPLQWLGKVSYALYAIHLLILYSLTCWLFVKLYPHLGYNFSAAVSLAASLPVMFVASMFLHRYIEVPSIKLASKVGEWAKKK